MRRGRNSLTSHSFPPKGKFCFPHAWVPTTWPLFHPDLVVLPGRLTGVCLRLSSLGIGSSAWRLEFYTFGLSWKLYQRATHRPDKKGRRPESKPRPLISVHVLAGIISEHRYIFRGLPYRKASPYTYIYVHAYIWLHIPNIYFIYIIIYIKCISYISHIHVICIYNNCIYNHIYKILYAKCTRYKCIL